MKAARYTYCAIVCCVSLFTMAQSSLAQTSFPVFGNISAGKFYTYSAAPSSTYPDVDPVAYGMSSGVKLTDGNYETGSYANSVAWYGASPDIVLNLGKTYAIDTVSISASSNTSAAIRFPSHVVIYTSTDGSTYTQYGNFVYFPTDTTGFSHVTEAGNGGWVNARYIKLSVISQGNWTFTDEIEADGTIPNTARYWPGNNAAYLGAYPVDSNGYLNSSTIEAFETLTGKQLAHVLWYGDWSNSYNASGGVGSVIHNNLVDTINGRSWMLQLGWMPTNNGAAVSLATINSGTWDGFLYTWFTQAAQDNQPIFMRFASEMNGDWTSWGGYQNGANAAAAQAYVAMWRRVYNIAEYAYNVQNASSKLAWVWCPDAESWPRVSGAPWNAIVNYYPGDQYVDWVGTDTYDGGPDNSDPGYWISPLYAAYGDRKPMMTGECGGSGADQGPFIDSLFDCIENAEPMFNSVCWWNSTDGASSYILEPLSTGLTAYANRIADSRYISRIQGN